MPNDQNSGVIEITFKEKFLESLKKINPGDVKDLVSEVDNAVMGLDDLEEIIEELKYYISDQEDDIKFMQNRYDQDISLLD